MRRKATGANERGGTPGWRDEKNDDPNEVLHVAVKPGGLSVSSGKRNVERKGSVLQLKLGAGLSPPLLIPQEHGNIPGTIGAWLCPVAGWQDGVASPRQGARLSRTHHVGTFTVVVGLFWFRTDSPSVK